MSRNSDEGHEPDAENGRSTERRGHFGLRGFRGGRALGGQLGEEVLAERLARGEIDQAEYQERLRDARSRKDGPRDA